MTRQEKNARQNKKAREQKALAIIKFHGQCCACGKKCDYKHLNKWEFHHTNGNRDKKNNVSNMLGRNSWEVIENELAKCVLLCNECHSDLHEDIGENPTTAETTKWIVEHRTIVYDI